MLAVRSAALRNPGRIDSMPMHQPVMLQEALAGLRVVAGGTYIDATFGRGGHSRAILEQLGPGGTLHVVDQDPAAVDAARHLAATHVQVRVHASSFDRLAILGESEGLQGRVDGILFDLGVSSPQLDDPARGFSFLREGPLDMRMNPQEGESAAQWLARAREEEIAEVLWRYGEERASRRIARAIVAAREERPLQTTEQLAALVLEVHRGPWQRIHPATRSFQAIRIHINRELERLEPALAQAVDLLAPLGRLVVISFHSLEDRIVKRYLRERARGDAPGLRLIGRAQLPGAAEQEANPRARSAVLRVAERLP